MAKKLAKTSKKNNTSFFSKLVPRSSKAKLIVFLVAFAVVGGGIMTYRSFAASDSFAVTADAGTMTAHDGATIDTEKKGSKSNRKVIKIPQTTNARATISNSATVMNDYRAFLYRNAGKEIRLCGFMRPSSTQVEAQVFSPAGSNWEYLNVSASNGSSSAEYKYLCTKYSRLPAVVQSYSIAEVRVKNSNDSRGIYIWGIVIEAR